MATSVLELLKEHYGHSQWAGRNRLSEELLILGYLPTGNECPGWKLELVEHVEPTSGGDPAAPAADASPEIVPLLRQSMRDRPEDPALERQHSRVVGVPRSVVAAPLSSPKLSRSFWRPRQGSPATRINANVYELNSRREGHEFLLRLLSDFQAPLMQCRDELGFGDVAFSGPSDEAILFARANMVYLIRNVDRQLVSATQFAGWFDRDLITRPAAAAERVLPAAGIAAEIEAGASLQLPLEAIEVAAAADEPVGMYKIFAGDGEIYQNRGRVFFKPGTAGEKTVEIYHMRRRDPPARCTFHVRARSATISAEHD